LQACVRHLAHISLLDLTIDVVAVGAVDGAEIFFNGDENWGGGHLASVFRGYA
jgi:hypothetical protein